MANYYQVPPEFILAPSPQFQILSLNHIRLLSNQLKSETVNYVIVDPRCQKLKMILRRGEGQVGESLTLLCAPDAENVNVPLEAGLNLHTATHKWLYKRNCDSKSLSLVFLSEDHVGGANLTANFNTYVKLLKPDVVIVSERVFATRLHDQILDLYPRYCRAQLLNDGNNILWLYHNATNMSINVALEVEFGFINIERVMPPPDEGSEVDEGPGV